MINIIYAICEIKVIDESLKIVKQDFEEEARSRVGLLTRIIKRALKSNMVILNL